ncbi:uncharacterized protein LOC119605867 [Lucilia sericata]|uniref:uncharacterized protein LOC119605867 n=1 Tax=Lucilia sericata TaxID=13632 RepID=UPI0018A82646|nr:uncharacterized protein LOC119605867 [Lucilia sericata]
MYKFKCCSETENEISRGPLLFSHLDTSTNVLISETLDLQQEFLRKTKFVNEQFMNICKNEKEIVNVFHMLEVVQQQFFKVEEELKIVECMLQQFEVEVQHLEILSKIKTFCMRNPCVCGHCSFCNCKTERQIFLELLEETNRKVEKLPTIVDDIKELQTYERLKNPYVEIFAILNMHCNLLNNIDNNLNILADKWAFIELLQKKSK